MDLADPAAFLPGDEHAPAPARMEERLLSRDDLDRGAELPAQALDYALDRIEVGLDRLCAPRARAKPAGCDGPDPPRLERRRRALAHEAPGEHTVLGQATLAQICATGLE